MTNRERQERMMQNELYVIEDMKRLLEEYGDTKRVWQGTKTDLIEMVHILYESGEMRDEYDIVVPFKVLLQRTFDIYDMKVPKNACTYLAQARACQGLKRAPLLMRYKRNS